MPVARRRKRTTTARRTTTRRRRRTTTTRTRRGKRSTALSRPVPYSGPLAKFMGKSSGPRTDVVKKIWAHIKRKNLQDPNNRRMIRPDATLAPIIGSRPIHMMSMTKAYSKFMPRSQARKRR